MKLRKFITLAMAVGMVFVAQGALATPVSDTIIFSNVFSPDPDYGYNYINVRENISYTHTLTGLSSTLPMSLLGAELSVVQKANSDTELGVRPEVWLSSSGSDIYIGRLTYSLNWTTDTFDLSPIVGLLGEISSTDPWSLTVKLYDTQDPINYIQLHSSTLTVDVPEPGTMLLLGLGLIGLAGVRRKFKK